jgi:lysophospholipase L1-like esterase
MDSNNIKAQMEKMMQQQWQQKVKSFSCLNKFAQKGKIVFVGSSLAENFPICEMLQNLDKRYIVYNRGIGGDVIEGLLKRMEESVFELEPKKIFINIGTNDIIRDGYSREKLMSGYSHIIELIKRRLPQSEIYVMSYYPVNRELEWLDKEMVNDMFGARTNNELIAVNGLLRQMAEAMGLVYINLFDCLLDKNGNLREEFAIDGMHFYPNGYAVILEKLLPYFD